MEFSVLLSVRGNLQSLISVLIVTSPIGTSCVPSGFRREKARTFFVRVQGLEFRDQGLSSSV